MKKIIYYFSGTGNSMRAACRIAQALGDTDIISMRCNPKEVPADGANIIGFVFPVYHWTMPDAAIRFVRELKINPNAYIFAVSTLIRINCISFEVLAGLLQEKGASLAYAKTLATVGSQLTTYEAQPDPKIAFPKAEKALSKISSEIASQTKRKYPKANLLTRTIYPTRMKYTKMLPEADKGFLISGECIGCGICESVCPVRNIEMKDGRPTHKHQCSFCMGCMGYCPKNAVNYSVTADLKEKYPFFEFSLTEEKTRFHNPYISSSDLSTDTRHID